MARTCGPSSRREKGTDMVVHPKFGEEPYDRGENRGWTTGNISSRA